MKDPAVHCCADDYPDKASTPRRYPPTTLLATELEIQGNDQRQNQGDDHQQDRPYLEITFGSTGLLVAFFHKP